MLGVSCDSSVCCEIWLVCRGMFRVLWYAWCVVRYVSCAEICLVCREIFRVLWYVWCAVRYVSCAVWYASCAVRYVSCAVRCLVGREMFRVPWDVSCAVRYVWCAVRCFVYCEICLVCCEICFVCCEIYLVCREICFVCCELCLVCRQICIMCCEICLVCRGKFSVWQFLAAKCHEQKNTLWSTGLRVFEKVPFMYKKGHGSGAGTGYTEITALSQERGKKLTENCMATAFHIARSSLCY
jgi:hypothetical protein